MSKVGQTEWTNTRGAAEALSSLLPEHSPSKKRRTEASLLHRRSMGQRGREGRGIHMLSDEMHDGLFQHRGGQAPAGEVLLATVLDEVLGDVVAEPLPVFLFGVARASAGVLRKKSIQRYAVFFFCGSQADRSWPVLAENQ